MSDDTEVDYESKMLCYMGLVVKKSPQSEPSLVKKK